MRVVVMDRFKWTVDEYDQTPLTTIRLIHEYMAAEAEAARHAK
jgi:hypothetical protein